MATPYTTNLIRRHKPDTPPKTPQENHAANFNKMPMQGDCLYFVRYQNIARREADGWIPKPQNALQEAKLTYARVIAQKEKEGLLAHREATKLYGKVAQAKDTEELKAIFLKP